MNAGWLVTCVFIATSGGALLASDLPGWVKALLQGLVQAALYWKGLHEEKPEVKRGETK